jgi:isopentenyl phosphate kinase
MDFYPRFARIKIHLLFYIGIIDRERLYYPGEDSILIFLKLGGSLITDKNTPHTALPDVLQRLAGEIAAAWQEDPSLRLVLGHGSGSFGHVPARKFGTRTGVHSDEEWRGYAVVWQEAHALNQLVIDALAAAGLPAVAFPPSAAVVAENGRVAEWPLEPLQTALEHRLLPVIQGDVVVDRVRGGTILSTEDLFCHLAGTLEPSRILLAGVEEGVWQDYPARTRLVPRIDPTGGDWLGGSLQGSAAVDVTGGMLAKVESMRELARSRPGLDVLIFSGRETGAVYQALLGSNPGTIISGNYQGGKL